jgi:hypothetical protein
VVAGGLGSPDLDQVLDDLEVLGVVGQQRRFVDIGGRGDGKVEPALARGLRIEGSRSKRSSISQLLRLGGGLFRAGFLLNRN